MDKPAKTRGKVEPRVATLTVTLFLLFVLLAFSDIFVNASFEIFGDRTSPAWMATIVDVVLLSVLIPLGRRVRHVSWWLLCSGALITIVVDAELAMLAGTDWADHDGVLIASSIAYGFSLFLLAGAFAGAEFGSVLRPWVVAIVATYILSVLFNDVVIDGEYFQQVSQVIPLLLIAVGFEAKHFQRFIGHALGKAATIVTVVTLCFAEVMALAALLAGDDPDPTVAAGWYNYAAFVVTFEAVCITLWMLAVALITPREQDTLSAPPADTTEEPIQTVDEGNERKRLAPASTGVLAVVAVSAFAAGVAIARAVRGAPRPR